MEMDREILRRLFSKEDSDLEKDADGIGLKKVNQRRGQVYRPQYRPRIRSTTQEGASVRMKILLSSPVLKTPASCGANP